MMYHHRFPFRPAAAALLLFSSFCMAQDATELPPEAAPAQTPQTPPESAHNIKILPWKDGALGAISLYYDGRDESFFDFAIPALIRTKLPATFFLTPGLFEGSQSFQLLRWADAAKNTNITLGSQGWNTDACADEPAIAEQIAKSDASLRSIQALAPEALLAFARPETGWTIDRAALTPMLARYRNVMRIAPDALAGGSADSGALKTADEISSKILNEAEVKGTWKSLVIRKIGATPHAFSATEHEKLLRELSVRAAKRSLWVCSVTDGAAYRKAFESAKISSVSESGNGIDFRLECPPLPEAPETLLSLGVKVPADWKSAKVYFGETLLRLPVLGGRILFNVPAVPQNISISRNE